MLLGFMTEVGNVTSVMKILYCQSPGQIITKCYVGQKRLGNYWVMILRVIVRYYVMYSESHCSLQAKENLL